MLNATRRRFMALVAPASLAAKAIADEGIANAAGLSRGASLGLGSSAGMALPSANYGEPAQCVNAISWEDRQTKIEDYFRFFGIPDWLKQVHRQQSSYVMALDPDIACKRSWSMSVKIMTQRQRNYDRAIQGLHKGGWFVRQRRALSKTLGFDYNW